MEELINRAYQAIRKRGLITSKTTSFDFHMKISEEYNEYVHERNFGSKEREIEELIDFITAGIMYLKHSGYDFKKEFEKVVIKNETRKD